MTERILIVDGQEAIGSIVASILSTAGYKCEQAGSGVEALRLLQTGKEFDLILSSLMMSELDGMGLLERVRAVYPDIPFVMMSTVHDVGVVLAAIRAGACDYLLKPFEKEQLLNTVRRAIELRRSKLESGRHHG